MRLLIAKTVRPDALETYPRLMILNILHRKERRYHVEWE